MAVWPKRPNPMGTMKTARRVASVRSERRYSATNYDASPAKRPEPLRGQFGRKYDVKKVRNMLPAKREAAESVVRVQVNDASFISTARPIAGNHHFKPIF